MSAADDSSDGPAEQFSWVIPTRLAAPVPIPEGIHETLRLVGVLDAAEHCYRTRNLGASVSPDGSTLAPADQWLRVAFGLAGSIAESLVVAAACEVEVELLRSTGQPEAEIGGRFFSIASAQEVVGIGHRLVNLVERAVSTRTEYRDFLRASSHRAISDCAFVDDPRSAATAAWLSLNRPTVRALMRELCEIDHPSVRSGLGALEALVESREWIDLHGMRGEVFHRSRPESSIASGIDSLSGYVSLLPDGTGKVIGESVGGRTRYIGGDGRWVTEAETSRAALRRVASGAVDVTTALAAAVEPLTMGRRFVGPNRNGRQVMSQRFGAAWDEECCACCSSVDSPLGTEDGGG